MTHYYDADLCVAVDSYRQLVAEVHALESCGLAWEANQLRHWAEELEREIHYYESTFGYRVRLDSGTILQVLPATG